MPTQRSSPVSVFAVLTTLALSGCASPGPARSADQRIHGFVPARVSLGRQPWFSTVPFGSKFVNGRSELAIVAAIRAGCDCTGLDPRAFAGKEVDPGGALPVSGELRIGNKLGPQSVDIDLLLASGAIHVLTLEYEGYATYVVTPSECEFPKVDLDAVDVTADSFQPVIFRSGHSKVLDVASDVAWLSPPAVERQPQVVSYGPQ